MTFKSAVYATPSVATAYKSGLRALRAGDRGKVSSGDPRKLTGSIDLDDALREFAPTAPRWDYGIGFKSGGERAIWIEVHPASSLSIDDMLAKLSWLKNWLQSEAPDLRAPTDGKFYWIATDGRIAITPGSRQARRLASNGLIGPRRHVTLT